MVARHLPFGEWLPDTHRWLPDIHRLARGNLRSASADALDDCSDQRVYGCLNSPSRIGDGFRKPNRTFRPAKRWLSTRGGVISCSMKGPNSLTFRFMLIEDVGQMTSSPGSTADLAVPFHGRQAALRERFVPIFRLV
jgi:hypothetical protein